MYVLNQKEKMNKKNLYSKLFMAKESGTCFVFDYFLYFEGPRAEYLVA